MQHGFGVVVVGVVGCWLGYQKKNLCPQVFQETSDLVF